MVTRGSTMPFYLMEKAKEFNGGRPPQNPRERVTGLEGAIDATKKRIAEYKSTNADVSDLEKHLQNLEKRLKAENKT